MFALIFLIQSLHILDFAPRLAKRAPVDALIDSRVRALQLPVHALRTRDISLINQIVDQGTDYQIKGPSNAAELQEHIA